MIIAGNTEIRTPEHESHCPPNLKGLGAGDVLALMESTGQGAHETLTQPTPLDWFESEPDWGKDEGVRMPSYWLPSEVNPGQAHQVVLDDGVWMIGTIDIPGECMTVLDAITYTEEIQRCIAACAYLNARQVQS